MIYVIVATENEQLNEYILNKQNKSLQVVALAPYREAVADMVRTTKANTLLLSAYLKGSQDILETVFVARAAGLRVVFLAGDIKPNDDLIADLVAMGVYDVIFNPTTGEKIQKALCAPSNFGDAIRLLKVVKKPEGRKVRSLADRFLKLILPHEHEEESQPQLQQKQTKETVSTSQPNPPTKQEDQRRATKTPKVVTKVVTPKPKQKNKHKPEPVSAQRQAVIPCSMAARIWLVIGSAPRVGATSFALALTKCAAEMGLKVKVVDGGGGASAWVKNSDLFVPGSPEFAAAPGEITIVDTACSSDYTTLTALAESAVWVTDLSPGSLNIEPLVSGRTFVVGTRGASLRGLEELAEIREVVPICSLPEAPKTKEAQKRGDLPLPSNWLRDLKKCIDVLNVF